jgi:hypothetical protein
MQYARGMHRTSLRVLVISTVLIASAATAAAQRAPDTATLDRGDGITKLGFDLGLTFLDDDSLYDGALRVEPYGQYVTDSGFGFFGALPITVSFGDEENDPLLGDPDQDTVAIGNLDLGLLYVLHGPTLSWVFRGGVAAPTASDDLDGFLTNAAGVYPRLTDVALIHPDATYIRLGVSPLVHANKFFMRGDIGFDLGIDDDDNEGEELLRLNLAVGYDVGLVALSAELVNVGEVADDNDGDEDWIHTLAFAARFMTEKLEPFLAIGLPLDDSRDFVDLFLSAGIQATFR